jgi:hypothetical protein
MSTFFIQYPLIKFNKKPRMNRGMYILVDKHYNSITSPNESLYATTSIYLL